MISDLLAASPERLLAAMEAGLQDRRRHEVDQLRLVLAWADLHSGDPQDEPGAVPIRHGGPRLISVGGDGTPRVADLSLLEMAVARNESVFATRRALADAFDLRHRLPLVWAGVQDLRCELWVVRKIATMARKLTADQVVIVDEAVADALDEAPSRVLQIAEAKIIEADPVAHEERVRRNRRQKGVWISQPRPGDTVDGEAAGVGGIFARLDEADVVAYAQSVEDLSVALAANAAEPAEGEEPVSMDHWRAEAFALLADPAAALSFLETLADGPTEQPGPEPAPAPAPAPATSTAELVVHISLDAVTGAFGPVARVEGLGPRLLTQVRDLLARHAQVTITPVIDLNGGRSVNGYEHPSDVRRRSELRTLGDVFPHAARLFTKHGRPPDHDHTDRYVPVDQGGPPGQTGDHNDTPLGRMHHRAKTHAGFTVFQLGPDRWVWGTPHGLYRLVTSTGTSRLTETEYRLLEQQGVEIEWDLAG